MYAAFVTDVFSRKIVGWALSEWVSWWNEHRLHQALGYRTPREIETEYWGKHKHQVIIGNKANA